MASRGVCPSSRCASSAKSIIMIAFFLTMPISSTMPMMAKMSDRKSTRLNSSHTVISYAVFCLKKKKHTSALQSQSDIACRLMHVNITEGLDATRQQRQTTHRHGIFEGLTRGNSHRQIHVSSVR